MICATTISRADDCRLAQVTWFKAIQVPFLEEKFDVDHGTIVMTSFGCVSIGEVNVGIIYAFALGQPQNVGYIPKGSVTSIVYLEVKDDVQPQLLPAPAFPGRSSFNPNFVRLIPPVSRGATAPAQTGGSDKPSLHGLPNPRQE